MGDSGVARIRENLPNGNQFASRQRGRDRREQPRMDVDRCGIKARTELAAFSGSATDRGPATAIRRVNAIGRSFAVHSARSLRKAPNGDFEFGVVQRSGSMGACPRPSASRGDDGATIRRRLSLAENAGLEQDEAQFRGNLPDAGSRAYA
jgi:hypothetical protein